jgi:hypothetical protein
MPIHTWSLGRFWFFVESTALLAMLITLGIRWCSPRSGALPLVLLSTSNNEYAVRRDLLNKIMWNDLALYQHCGFLSCCTFSRSIWRSALIRTGPDQLPQSPPLELDLFCRGCYHRPFWIADLLHISIFSSTCPISNIGREELHFCEVEGGWKCCA